MCAVAAQKISHTDAPVASNVGWTFLERPSHYSNCEKTQRWAIWIYLICVDRGDWLTRHGYTVWANRICHPGVIHFKSFKLFPTLRVKIWKAQPGETLVKGQATWQAMTVMPSMQRYSTRTCDSCNDEHNARKKQCWSLSPHSKNTQGVPSLLIP